MKYWGEQRKAELPRHGKQNTDKDTQLPTLAEFALRFMERYVKANRQKPSTIESKQAILDGKLLPLPRIRSSPTPSGTPTPPNTSVREHRRQPRRQGVQSPGRRSWWPFSLGGEI